MTNIIYFYSLMHLLMQYLWVYQKPITLYWSCDVTVWLLSLRTLKKNTKKQQQIT